MLEEKLNNAEKAINRLNTLLDFSDEEPLSFDESFEMGQLDKELRSIMENIETQISSDTNLESKIKDKYQSTLKLYQDLMERFINASDSDEEEDSDFDADDNLIMMFPNEDSDEGYNWTMD